MKYIISGTDLKQVDKYTIDTIGIPSPVLMERAALSVAEEILAFAGETDEIVAVCGTGNNGADGIAVARILCNKGFNTCIYIVGNLEKATEEFILQKDIYEKVGGKIIEFTGNISGDIIVDALFGIGLSREVGGDYKKAIEVINARSSRYEDCSCEESRYDQINYASSAKVVAIDVPSGIHADTGVVMGTAANADITVTFGMQKTGLVFYPGADLAGKVLVKDIGFPVQAYDGLALYKSVTQEDLRLIPNRVNGSNKGNYGKALIIAGNDSMSGAAFMCCKVAQRMGIGMIKLFTTKETADVIKTTLPEVMITTYNELDYKDALFADLQWCDVVAVGPGMGKGSIQTDIIKDVLLSKIPTVIDADGINCISAESGLKRLLHNNVIITPHIGEMARFTERSVDDIKENCCKVAKENATSYGITVVLKDARTVISDGKENYINLSGNNGMSTAGSGDVLTGIVTALLAKKMKPVLVGALSAYIHGIAGDMAAKRLSKTALIATDIIDELVEITKLIEEKI